MITIEARIYTVNEVIAALHELDGQTILIAGQLQIEFEGDSVWHTPKHERRPEYGSSLWADFDHEALACGPKQLESFDGRHVVLTAAVNRQNQGHFGLWPGAILVRSIRKGL